jgi:hypothetical protein
LRPAERLINYLLRTKSLRIEMRMTDLVDNGVEEEGHTRRPDLDRRKDVKELLHVCATQAAVAQVDREVAQLRLQRRHARQRARENCADFLGPISPFFDLGFLFGDRIVKLDVVVVFILCGELVHRRSLGEQDLNLVHAGFKRCQNACEAATEL